MESIHGIIIYNKHKELNKVLTDATGVDIEAHVNGQTALTLACSLGREECIRILLDHGASPLTRNSKGWLPLHEAVSFGNRSVIQLMVVAQRKAVLQWFRTEGVLLLTNLDDSYFQLEWSFRSVLPFISRVCPSDTIKFYKRCKSVRIDTTLVGFENLAWIRGRLSLVFHDGVLVWIDHDRCIVQQLWPGEADADLTDEMLQEEVNVAFNTPIYSSLVIDWTSFIVKPDKKPGIWGLLFQEARVDCIDGFDTQVWCLDGLDCCVNVRDEHLLANPLPGYKHGLIPHKHSHRHQKESFRKSVFHVANPEELYSSSVLDQLGDISIDDESNVEEEDRFANYKYGHRNFTVGSSHVGFNTEDTALKKTQSRFTEFLKYRPSLDEPPHLASSSYDQLFHSFFDSANQSTINHDDFSHIGREMHVKSVHKIINASLWIHRPSNANNQLQPLQSNSLLTTIEKLGPLLDIFGLGSPDTMRSIREFIHIQLPYGVPVQIDFSLGRSLPMSLRFKFRFGRVEDPESLFDIPKYRHGHII